MLDHDQVHQLARSAAFSYPIPNASQLSLVTGSTIPWLYYCDPIEGNDPYSGEPVRSTVCVDISDVMDRKIEMLALHASQREWLRSHHGMDEYIDSMKEHSAMRGEELGSNYAEAFVQLRVRQMVAACLLQSHLKCLGEPREPQLPEGSS